MKSVCFCTMAIHAPYRDRARRLINDLPSASWLILTDKPDDFNDLDVMILSHEPTGPMAIDYLQKLPKTGNHMGAAAYHDKRFALIAALEHADTAIFLDADSRLTGIPILGHFPTGISVTPLVTKSIAEHLATCGSWRLSAFDELACYLTGDSSILSVARWCHETCISITRDGKECSFFDIWDRSAKFMQNLNVFSGEGGVLGLSAAIAGWTINYESLQPINALLKHESGGPKEK
ncbi:MAG: hypothetical protein IPL46_07140 [Saprospiraceae bacterium]|nr:hypothetical protein [Saprospiraceae bacterium]